MHTTRSNRITVKQPVGIMKDLKKAFDGRIATSASEDLICYIFGLSSQGTTTFPFSTAFAVAKIFGTWAIKRLPFNYTDWELANWRELYGSIPQEDLLSLAGPEETSFTLPQVLILDNTSDCNPLDFFKIYFDLSRFSLTREISGYTKHAFIRLDGWLRLMSRLLGKDYFNGDNLRLAELKHGVGEVALSLQVVKYNDYVATNLVMDYKNGSRPSLRQKIHGSKQLEPLNQSLLANNLGINFLIFTAEGELIIQLRSGKVAFRSGEYCPSSSGTVSPADIQSAANLSQCDLIQESTNELGLPPETIENIELLGITRELIRGGEPELFFVAYTTLTFQGVLEVSKKAAERYEHKQLSSSHFRITKRSEVVSIEKYNTFYADLLSCITKYAKRSSIPLLTAFALLEKQMNNALANKLKDP